MKLIFVFISAFSLLIGLSCSSKSQMDYSILGHDKQATVIVSGKLDNLEGLISGKYISLLPSNYIRDYQDASKKIEVSSIKLNYEISIPTQTEIYLDRVHFPLFLVPGDTLFLTINNKDMSNISNIIKFKGKDASINYYQLNRYGKLGKGFDEIWNELINSNYSHVALVYKIDSVRNLELNFLNKYVKVHALPKWYLDYIKNQILYKAAIIEMSYHETKNHNNYLRKVKINNQCAVLSSNYYGFINQYFFKLFQKEFSNKSVDTRHILGQTFLRYTDSLLTGEVRSIYRAYVISSFIIDYGLYDKAEKIIGKEGSGIESSKYVEYLKRYLSDREKLKSGTKAPNFYLLDSENNFKTLDDYQGNIVLLNFWFPGCTGCRIELSFEHKILDRYKNYNFKLINICFYSSGKNWRKALDQLGMRGVNLFANESWQNKLIQNYRIGSYPHYTLINVKGEIISNNPLRPSAGLSDEIQKFLAK